MEDIAQLVGIREAARQLGCSTEYLVYLETRGAAPPARRICKRRVYAPVEIEALREIWQARMRPTTTVRVTEGSEHVA